MTIEIARVLTSNQSEQLQDVKPVTCRCRCTACCLFGRCLSQEFCNKVHRVLSWVQQADVKDFNNFVNKDGQKTFVADWKVFVSLHARLSEACNVVKCEGEKAEK